MLPSNRAQTRRYARGLCARLAALWLLGLSGLAGCGGEDPPDAGTDPEEPVVTCGEGTALEDGQCMVVESPCPERQVRVDGMCRAVEETCGEGTVYDGMLETCVPSDSVVCGPQTERVEGVCRPVEDLCEEGTVRDPDTGTCVVGPEACASHTIFDPDLRRCVPSAEVCEDGTYFDDSMERCRPGRAVYGDCSNLVVLEGPITSDTVLPVGECYRVEGMLSVRDDAQLTIEAGVVVVFEQSAGLRLESGRLVTHGTVDRPVYLTGRDETPGHWFGISASNSGVDALSLEHTVVDWAGQDNGISPPAAILLADGSTLRAEGLQIIGSAGHGIYALDGDLVDIVGATLRDNAGGDVATRADALDAFDEASRFESDAPIVVLRGGISEEVSWRVPAVYRINRSLAIAASGSLAVAAGSRLRFDATRRFDVAGRLVMEGTQDAPVVVESVTGGAGSWFGIALQESSGQHILRHVTIRHAGQYRGRLLESSLLVEDAQVDLAHVTLEDGAGFGALFIRAQLSQSGPITVTDHAEAAVRVTPDVLGRLTGAVDAPTSRIRVAAGSVSSDARWESDLPLFFEGIVTVETGATVTIAAGQTLLFDLDAGLSMRSGVLEAIGTDTAPIEFDAAQPGSGNWRGLYFFDSRAPRNILEHVTIANGGGGNGWHWSGANGNLTLQDNAAVALRHVTLRDSGGPGVSVIRGGAASDCTMLEILDTPAVVGTHTTSAALCGM